MSNFAPSPREDIFIPKNHFFSVVTSSYTDWIVSEVQRRSPTLCYPQKRRTEANYMKWNKIFSIDKNQHALLSPAWLYLSWFSTFQTENIDTKLTYGVGTYFWPLNFCQISGFRISRFNAQTPDAFSLESYASSSSSKTLEENESRSLSSLNSHTVNVQLPLRTIETTNSETRFNSVVKYCTLKKNQKII